MGEEFIITKEKLILVEGKDDEDTLSCFFDILGINDIQIRKIGTKPKSNHIKDIVNAPGFEGLVTSLGIIRDADEYPDRTFQSIQTALRNAKLPIPDRPQSSVKGSKPFSGDELRVNVYIMPDGDNSPGTLETLFVKSIEDNDLYKKCIQPFLDCGENNVKHIFLDSAFKFIFLLRKFS